MAKVPPKRWALFLLGAVAPLSVYVVFYATHAEALIAKVNDLYKQSGILGMGVAGFLFLGVAALCGGWALVCDSRTYKAAFSAGLGLPALILGGSGAFAPSAKSTSMRHPTEVQVASLSFTPMLAAAEPGVFSKAFGLVFNPVGTVVEGKTAALQQQTAKLQQQTTTLQQTNATLVSQQEAVQTQLASLGGRVERLQLEKQQAQVAETSAKAAAAELGQRMRKTQADLAQREAKIKELDVRTSDFERTVASLQQKITDAETRLAASSGNDALLTAENKRLAATVADQSAALLETRRALAGVARESGLRGAGVLNDALRSARQDEAKISIIGAIGAVPKASAVPDIRKQLLTVEREAAPEVQRAARSVLNQ